MVQGLVLRTWQSEGFGKHWYAELWDEALGIRYYLSTPQREQRTAAFLAERIAQTLGMAVVVRKTGRFRRNCASMAQLDCV